MITDMLLALSKNSTSIYFNTTHRCTKHDRLITLEHMDTCSYFPRTAELREYLEMLKASNIRDWEDNT